MKKKTIVLCNAILIFVLMSGQGCSENNPNQASIKTVPHETAWGIYQLDLVTQDLRLVFGTDDEIFASSLQLNSADDRLVFAQKTGGIGDDQWEIYSISIEGNDLRRLTDNNYWDIYPIWSPDGSRIAYLSKQDANLDIFVMDSDGSNSQKFFDSGENDADIDWAGDTIVFTSQFAIWKIEEDGSSPTQVTDLAGRGEWGEANLPKGDYDPRLSYDGKLVVFERLEGVDDANGNYNLFVIGIDGTGETRLTDNGYAQGLAQWSHLGDKIVYVVAAMDGQGKYDLYMINSDGTGNHDITPSYFPNEFLCHAATFSEDDSKLFFIGQWWQ